jgi:protein SCO1/2
MGAIKTPPKRQSEGPRNSKPSPGGRRPSGLALGLMAAGVLLAAGLGYASWRLTAAGAPSQASTGVASIGGPFQMVDQDGKAVDERVLKGRWSAVFFGYTYCPDVCPATLTALKVAKNRLGPKAAGLQAVLISIDPERDTPAQLKTYLSSPAFPQPITGLTGTPQQIAAVAKAYKAYYAKNGTGPDYLMDHGSAIYLMDPKGQFHSLVSTAQGVDSMAFAIGQAMDIR